MVAAADAYVTRSKGSERLDVPWAFAPTEGSRPTVHQDAFFSLGCAAEETGDVVARVSQPTTRARVIHEGGFPVGV